MRLLLDDGADITARDANGQTGLHLASVGGHTATVRLLLARGASLVVENAWGGHALSHVLWAAVEHDPHVDYAPVVVALVDAGAPVEPGSAAWWRAQTVLQPSSADRVAQALEEGERRQAPPGRNMP